MEEQNRHMSIFELTNQNVVEMSQDLVKLYALVEDIHKALFPTPAEGEESEEHNEM